MCEGGTREREADIGDGAGKCGLGGTIFGTKEAIHLGIWRTSWYEKLVGLKVREWEQ